MRFFLTTETTRPRREHIQASLYGNYAATRKNALKSSMLNSKY